MVAAFLLTSWVWVGCKLGGVCSVLLCSILRALGTRFGSVLMFFVTVAFVNCRLLYENSLVGQMPSELGMLRSLTRSYVWIQLLPFVRRTRVVCVWKQCKGGKDRLCAVRPRVVPTSRCYCVLLKCWGGGGRAIVVCEGWGLANLEAL